MKLITSRAITYTFGPGQEKGIDNVTVAVTVEVERPLTKDVTFETIPVTIALPSQGWTDDDVLKALQTKYPEFDVQWQEAPAAEVVAE